MHQIKQSPATSATHNRVLTQAPAVPLAIQLLANVSGKAVGNNSNLWASVIHVGDPHGIPGSRL